MFHLMRKFGHFSLPINYKKTDYNKSRINAMIQADLEPFASIGILGEFNPASARTQIERLFGSS